ncbi:uncharacterized protein PV07_11153 [Cladophialophora immunda]|uniref:Uncharacterized protein n=1 Tax=Cladophialophora immunda TaxID=569365 RepID=A0A0D2BX34_9EURO|nr:uncharacterized protein PV07_11153 [Cladophialophora immunda]KIW22905.1 hypothetical protein PV07_11153 [Cladophialophora immunda]OQU93824.1 hypothetical protein CLAIMM_00288 [Cladophialophora immunda]
MYPSLVLPWSTSPSERENTYRTAGLVKTRGTLFLLPPPTSTLRDTFNAPPRPKTRMSSGAVALCKHFERGGASSEHGRHHPFWTLPTGSNENKTEIARVILEDMLVQAVWKNVMLLHHGVAVYEIRNAGGYGMRWTLDIEEKRENEQADMGIPTDIQTTAASPDALSQGEEDEDDFHKDWVVTKTTFRGFLEPIAGMDHELPGQEVNAAKSSHPDEQKHDRMIE